MIYGCDEDEHDDDNSVMMMVMIIIMISLNDECWTCHKKRLAQ